MPIQFNYTTFLEIQDGFKKINLDQTKICNLETSSVITHAHSDHVCNTNQKTYATKETIDFLQASIPNNKFDFVELKYNKKIKLSDDIIMTPLNAGHILGSAMYYFEDLKTSKTILYTGDFNTSPSLLLKKANPISADVLFTESTFGKPEFNFKEREMLYDQLASQIKKDISKNKIVILAGYTLGKNQELIAFVNNYLSLIPLVDNKTFTYSKIYNENGYKLNFELLDHNFLSANIIILPLSIVNKDLLNSLRLESGKIISSYVMTGWKYSRGSNLINISDHSDYESLLDFVSNVNPKVVYTMHGFSKSFATSINFNLGINANPINILKKKELRIP